MTTPLSVVSTLATLWIYKSDSVSFLFKKKTETELFKLMRSSSNLQLLPPFHVGNDSFTSVSFIFARSCNGDVSNRFVAHRSRLNELADHRWINPHIFFLGHSLKLDGNQFERRIEVSIGSIPTLERTQSRVWMIWIEWTASALSFKSKRKYCNAGRVVGPGGVGWGDGRVE